MRINKKILKFIPALLYFALIWYMSSKQVGIDISKVDKLLHVVEYALMGFLLSFGFELNIKNFITKGRYCLLIAIATGATEEIHQCFVPWRCGSWGDLIADIIGCAIGMAIWIALIHILKQRKAFLR